MLTISLLSSGVSTFAHDGKYYDLHLDSTFYVYN